MTRRKYFDKLSDAKRALEERKREGRVDVGVYKMHRGTRHAGKYAVCSYMEYLNTY